MVIKINEKDRVYFQAYPDEGISEGEYTYRRFLRKPMEFYFCVKLEEDMN